MNSNMLDSMRKADELLDHEREMDERLSNHITGNGSASVKTLSGDAANTHDALEDAAKELHAADLAMRAAQERYRKALAAHMAAITGTKVEP